MLAALFLLFSYTLFSTSLYTATTHPSAPTNQQSDEKEKELAGMVALLVDPSIPDKERRMAGKALATELPLSSDDAELLLNIITQDLPANERVRQTRAFLCFATTLTLPHHGKSPTIYDPASTREVITFLAYLLEDEVTAEGKKNAMKKLRESFIMQQITAELLDRTLVASNISPERRQRAALLLGACAGTNRDKPENSLHAFWVIDKHALTFMAWIQDQNIDKNLRKRLVDILVHTSCNVKESRSRKVLEVLECQEVIRRHT